ncbi:J domain-containing protein, partial [bacterium D16-59]
MEYFKSVSNLSELRKQYKELLKVHHPDNGGNVADMQEINAEYDRLFKILKDKHDSKSAGSDQSSFDNMQYDFAEDEKL